MNFFVLSLILTLGSVRAQDPAQFVNPFIGTQNGGHVFPGATLPWGSVKPGADSRSGDNQAGFVSDGSPVTGISQLHDDGTGGSASLGQFALLPLTSTECAGNDLTKCTLDRSARALGHGEPSASPGYFSIPLNNGVQAEVTVTQHTALHRFTYPAGTEQMLLLLDITNDLAERYQGDGRVSVSPTPDPTTSSSLRAGTRITGTGRWIPSFGQKTYQVYFCFDAPGASEVVGAQYYHKEGREYAFTDLMASSGGEGGRRELAEFEKDIGRDAPAGVVLAFSPGGPGSSSNPQPEAQERRPRQQSDAQPTLEIRMGVSWTSTEKACAYAEEEIPEISSAGFETVKAQARAEWNALLSTVELDTTGVPRDTLELFWSSLYRTYIAPVNVTGDNPLWASEEPYWDSFYCIWDTFRVVHPLYAITAPTAQAEIVRALIDVYRHAGWLPDCRMSGDKGFTQGGSNADSLLGDSYLKGVGVGATSRRSGLRRRSVSGGGLGGIAGRITLDQREVGVDWRTGLEAMVKDATVMGDFEVEGRGGINSREKLGYVPVGDTDHPSSPGSNTRSASRLLEYAYNDFDIALVALSMGNTTLATHYFNKSHDWMNIWNPDAKHSGFTGFIQPRNADGSWFFSSYDHGGVFRPDHCSPVYGHTDCYGGWGGGEFYEASSWEYSFYVPHDMARLVGLMGGKKTFSARLDHFFEAGFHDMGDEPGFLPTYLYNYVGQPTKTVDRVDEMVAMYYNTSVNGLPGNDDSGSMGAYAVWSHLGFFPVAGQSTYLLNRPYFPKITIHNPASGAVSIIIAKNFSPGNKYIQSAKLDGESYTKNWISHDLFRYGGTLELVMGASRESTWGTKEEDLPMSLSTGGFGCREGCAPPGASDGANSESGGSDAEAEDVAAVTTGADGGGSVLDEPSGTNSFWSYLLFLLLAD
ncbi:alpha-1,2-mannosidase, putative subfamily [Mycena sanguinolenta]|nr:alpha-1,2-mannosidase, putative subfamily [Mycena sanguinolenta]